MRNPATGSAELTQVARQDGLKLEIIQLDVNDPKSSEQAVQEVLERAGKLDVLINNAGIRGGAPIEEMPEEFLRAVFETNFFGAMRMMRLVVPTMRQAQSGAIVNVSSISGRLAGAGNGAYAVSKFALEAASEVLAQEVRRFNIRVVIIEPGVIQTPIVEKGGSEPDPNSPYYEFALRSGRMWAERLENPSPPELVAETIQLSLETDQPKLRYLVGEDAKRWAAGRQAMTDEEWVDMGREMTLDEYAALYLEHFGMEI
jgi:NAD(P)-dependent dehydrogenase (short-subunit alcohol dehydrogenase family)